MIAEKKGFMALTLFSLSLFFMLVLALAAEPKYNFGSAQAGNTIVVYPGEETFGELYFYNVYGNRITFVELGLGEVPEGWEVILVPPLREIPYTIAGVESVDTANLYVEPSNFVDEPESKASFECGDMRCKYIPSPAGGYMLAKVAQVKVTPPEDVELFKDFSVVVNARAFWHGEPGTVAANQVRTFSYTARTTSRDLEERIVEQGKPLDLSEYSWVLVILVIAGAYYLGQKSGRKR